MIPKATDVFFGLCEIAIGSFCEKDKHISSVLITSLTHLGLLL